MNFLLMSGGDLDFILYLLAIFWSIPIIILVVGLTRLKSRPKNAKTLIIIAGVWLVVGGGICGSMLY
ncbi:MAG: hypothetical protein AB8H03_06860 [Saprospiraceae bacterium]